MSRSRLVRSASVFVVAIGALLSAFPQTQPSPSTSSDEFKTEAEKLYAGPIPIWTNRWPNLRAWRMNWRD